MRNRNRTAFTVILPAVAAFALAQTGAEVLAKLGLTPASAREAIVESLASGSVYSEAAFKAFKALPSASRAAVVKAGLAWVKAAAAGPEFKADYAKYREAQKPAAGEAVLSVEDFLKKQRQDAEKQAGEMRKAAGMDAATRKTMEEAAKQMMAQIEAMEKDPAQRALLKDMLEAQKAEAKSSRDEALAEWNIRVPADPKPLIASRIREFLETSADVDFAAKLVKKGGLMRFENEDYEAKPGAWKLCFRAGREAVEAARAFAESWLAELEK